MGRVSIRIFTLTCASVLALGGLCIPQKKVASVGHQQTYKCNTEGIQLEGALTEKMFYGPPGFGESPAKDVRDKVLVLKLAKSIMVESIENAEVKGSESSNRAKNIKEVQLFIRNDQTTKARKLLGKTVIAVGTLSEAITPRQYTDITMDVKTIGPKL